MSTSSPPRLRWHFYRLEPLLEDVGQLNLKSIDWVIVGGESGPGARPMNRKWVVSIQKQCRRARVPFFFKQWGGVQKSKNGRELDGATFDQFPAAVRNNSCLAGNERTMLVEEFSREAEMLPCLS